MALADMVSLTFKTQGIPVVIRPDGPMTIQTIGILGHTTEQTGLEHRPTGRRLALTIPGADGRTAGINTILETDGTRYKVVDRDGDGKLVCRLFLGAV